MRILKPILSVGAPVVALSFGIMLRAQESVVYDREIGTLFRQCFRISTSGGKRTMQHISGYAGEPSDQTWWSDRNVAMLSRAEAATSVKGTPLILAFLDFPASEMERPGSIAALFNRNATNTPLCFSPIQPMGDPKFYFYGSIRRIETRTYQPGEYFVCLTLMGGDAGDCWVSLVFLHLTSSCKLTKLYRLYADRHCDEIDQTKCEGSTISYRFLDDHSVSIETLTLGADTISRNRRKRQEQLDLKAALFNKALRRFGP